MKYIIFISVSLGMFCITCQLESSSNKFDTTPTSRQTAKQIKIDSGDIAFLMGQFNPISHSDFVEIPTSYANRKGMYLQKETLQAFAKMHEHAIRDSIHLVILSATRNFASQKSIWEAKWTGKRLVEDGQNLASTTPDPVERALKILRYSSMPGTSRHHWGTDIDLNHLTNEFFSQGEGKRIYNWLTLHAPTYGFCQPYSPKGVNRPNGYLEEKWHWSYLPLALPFTRMAMAGLRDSLIAGFLGSETAKNIKVVENYVLGINPNCKKEIRPAVH